MQYYKLMRKVRQKFDLSPEQYRRYLDRAAIFNPAPLLGVRHRVENIGSIEVDVIEPKTKNSSLVIMHIHGGAFAFGSPKTHRSTGVYLSKLLGCQIYFPNYRKTPEYAYPIPLNDCWETYAHIVENHPQDKIVVIGDSAGGNLCASLVLKLQNDGIRDPDAVVLMSPWVDLSSKSKSMERDYHEESVFDSNDLQKFSSLYLKDFSDAADDPRVSPIYGLNDKFPVTLIQATKNEMLFPDSESFANKLTEVGGKVKLEVEENLFHSWQLFPELLPAAKKSLKNVAAFVKKEVLGEE